MKTYFRSKLLITPSYQPYVYLRKKSLSRNIFFSTTVFLLGWVPQVSELGAIGDLDVRFLPRLCYHMELRLFLHIYYS